MKKQLINATMNLVKRMNTYLWIIIITFIAGVFGTGLGGLIGAILKRDSNKIVSLLLSFAGGVMLSVVTFDLVPNAFHPEGSVNDLPVWIVVFGVILGYVIVYFLNAWIDNKTNPEVLHVDNTHPKTADDLDELIHADHLNAHKKQTPVNNYELFIAGIVMACTIALHNMPEGMVIGASYASDSTISISGSGLLVAIVIGLHNIPEGMAVVVPLIAGGMKKPKAILVTAASGAPTIIGALIGFSLGLISPVMLSLALSFAGGAMLYVVLGELVPEAILMWKSKLPSFFMLIGLITGLILVQI